MSQVYSLHLLQRNWCQKLIRPNLLKVGHPIFSSLRSVMTQMKATRMEWNGSQRTMRFTTTCWSLSYSMCVQLKGLIHNFIWGVVMRTKELKLNGILSSCYKAWVTFLGYTRRQGYKIIMHGRQQSSSWMQMMVDAKFDYHHLHFLLMRLWHAFRLRKIITLI